MPLVRRVLPALAGAAVLGGAAPTLASAADPVHSAAGPTPASIQSAVDGFRLELGVLNPNNGVSFESGRREINWDGVPDGFAAPAPLPADFFNRNSPRGLVLSGAPAFSVSADATNPTSTPVRFGDLDPSNPAQLTTFSAQRLFGAPGSRSLDVAFRIPGTDTPASVTAFGAIFTDVDVAGASRLTLYDERDDPLADLAAPVQGAGLSFLSYTAAADRRIARVRITTGTHGVAAGLADAPPAQDVVALDDFIYGEPKAIPPAPPAPADPPAPPAVPATALPADSTPPRITRLRLRHHGHVVRYRLSEAAVVTVKLRQRGKTVRTIERAKQPGRNVVRFRRIAAGRYRLRVVGRDAAGNTSAPVRRSFRIHR